MNLEILQNNVREFIQDYNIEPNIVFMTAKTYCDLMKRYCYYQNGFAYATNKIFGLKILIRDDM